MHDNIIRGGAIVGVGGVIHRARLRLPPPRRTHDLPSGGRRVLRSVMRRNDRAMGARAGRLVRSRRATT